MSFKHPNAHARAGTSHAVAAVGAHSIVRVDAPRDNAHVQVVLGTAVGVGARAQAGQRHLVHLRASRGLFHREQATRLFTLAAKLLERKKNFPFNTGKYCAFVSMKTDGKDEGNWSCAKREIRKRELRKSGHYKFGKIREK